MKYFIFVAGLFFYYIILAISSEYIPVECTNSTVKTICNISLYFVLPIAVAGFFCHLFKVSDSRSFLIVISLFIALILPIGWFFSSFCGVSSHTLYRNKANPSITIVERSLGCGAWDSSFPEYYYCELRPLTPFFNIVRKIDKKSITKSQWILCPPFDQVSQEERYKEVYNRTYQKAVTKRKLEGTWICDSIVYNATTYLPEQNRMLFYKNNERKTITFTEDGYFNVAGIKPNLNTYIISNDSIIVTQPNINFKIRKKINHISEQSIILQEEASIAANVVLRGEIAKGKTVVYYYSKYKL
jgi:hypothetical protein